MSLVYINTSQGQNVNWTQFEDLPDSLRKDTRPILIFVHTDWCKYCQMQQATTFKNDSVIELLNNNYYTLKLNAETKEDISFFGRTYANKGKTHSLASFIAKKNGIVSFPTTIILSSQQELIVKETAFTDQKTLLKLLKNINLIFR